MSDQQANPELPPEWGEMRNGWDGIGATTLQPNETGAEQSVGEINGAQARFGAGGGVGRPNSRQPATFSAAGWREKLMGSDRHTEGILGGWMKTDNMMSRAEGDDENWVEEEEGEGGGEERTRVGS